jgi:hypothetical protein
VVQDDTQLRMLTRVLIWLCLLTYVLATYPQTIWNCAPESPLINISTSMPVMNQVFYSTSLAPDANT